MKPYFCSLLIAAISLSGMSAAHAASPSPSETLQLRADSTEVLIGLLLPAVQKVREAAAQSPDAKTFDRQMADTEVLIGLLLPAVQKVRASVDDKQLAEDLGDAEFLLGQLLREVEDAQQTAFEPGIGDQHMNIIAILIGLLEPVAEDARESAAAAGYTVADVDSDPTEILIGLLLPAVQKVR